MLVLCRSKNSKADVEKTSLKGVLAIDMPKEGFAY